MIISSIICAISATTIPIRDTIKRLETFGDCSGSNATTADRIKSPLWHFRMKSDCRMQQAQLRVYTGFNREIETECNDFILL